MKGALPSLAVLLIQGSGISNAAVIAEVELNDTLATAQNVGGSFSTGPNSDIGSHFGIDPSVTPWVSITSSGGNSFDYYTFATTSPGRISIDIDYGMPDVDTMIGLWVETAVPGTYQLLGALDDGNLVQSSGFVPLDPGSEHGYDPSIYFDGLLPAGNYVVGVGEFYSDFFNTGMDGNPLDAANTYTLQITAENVSSISTIPEPFSLGGVGALMVSGLFFRCRPCRSKRLS